jgi:hypothetical protein
MQSADWISLIGSFPRDQHDNLIFVTSIGIELAIQAILRTEEDYIVVRARMSGTDISRTLFVPYGNITYVGFLKPVKEGQVRAMYGEPEPAPAEATTGPEGTGAASDATAPESLAAAPGPETDKVNGAANPAALAPPPDKKAMLERLRSRSFVGTMKMPPNR